MSGPDLVGGLLDRKDHPHLRHAHPPARPPPTPPPSTCGAPSLGAAKAVAKVVGGEDGGDRESVGATRLGGVERVRE